jgi:tetratricopeptide (TPR) repeat protein
MASIDKALNKDNKPYYQAASYYYDNNKDMKVALDWVNKAVEQNPKAYWVMLLKAKIELKLKDKAAAKASAEKVIEMAKADKDDSYVKNGENLLIEINKLK